MGSTRYVAASDATAGTSSSVGWILVAGALLMSITGLAPVAGSGGVKSVALISAILTGLLGLACAVATLLRCDFDEQVRYPSRVLAAAAAFVSWLLVSALLSGRGIAAFLGEPYNQLGWLVLVALSAIAFVSIGSAPGITPVLRACAPWFLLVQYLWVIAGSHGGTLGHSTNLGVGILLSLPWVVPIGERARLGTYARWVAVAVGFLIMAAVAARVALAVGLVWLAAYAVRNLGGSRAVKILTAVLLGSLAVATMLLFRPQSVTGMFDQGSLGGRPEMIELTVASLADSPLLGYGPDGFVSGTAQLSTVASAAEGAALARWIEIKDPHNALAWVAVSGGIVGTLLFVWLVAELVVVWRRSSWGPDRRAAAAATIMAFLVFLSSPASFQLLPLFAIVLGVSLHRPGMRNTQRAGGVRTAAGVTFAVASLVLVCLAGARVSVIRPGISQSTAERATRLASIIEYDAELWHEASIAWGTVFNETGDPGAKERDVESARWAARVDGRNPYHALEYARVLAYYGDDSARVIAAFEETLERMPFFPVASAEYAGYLARGGRLEAARAQFELAHLALEYWGDDAPPATQQAIWEAEAALAAAQ